MTNKKSFFGTDGIRGRVGEFPITPDFVLKLSWVVGSVFKNHSNENIKILIGKDTRISGYMFESAIESGLSAAGVDSLLLGPIPTPAIAYMTRNLRADAGIVISASHNPYYDNGIKVFLGNGYKLTDELVLEIESKLETQMETLSSDNLGKAVRIDDAKTRYVEYCKSTFPDELSLKGFKIVLDCANGSTYNIAPTVFCELGAEVIDLAVNPDGFNINDNCGSTNPGNLQKTVLEKNAHLGIGFDGDGDRVIMVDHKGEILDGDEITFIIANFLNNKNKLEGGVVGTLMSNYGLELALKNAGINFVRAKVGEKYVLKEMLTKKYSLGGEQSGHIICLNVSTTGDGIVSALQVLAAMIINDKSLNIIKSGMEKLPQKLINVPIKTFTNLDENSHIQSAIKIAENRLKNLGRVLLRPSGTETLIRVMVEGYDLNKISEIAEELAEIVRKSVS